MIDLDDPTLGITIEEINAEWEQGRGGKMEIKRRFMIRNLKIAIEHADDFATLRKAMVRLMEIIR
jgi:hypothetical protein